MVVSDPSCNTDQGVYLICECLGVKPIRVMKVNAGENP